MTTEELAAIEELKAALGTRAAAAAGEGEKAAFDFVTIITMITTLVKFLPQIKEIIDAIRKMFPQANGGGNGGEWPTT